MKKPIIITFFALLSLTACRSVTDTLDSAIADMRDFGQTPLNEKISPLPERLIREGACPAVEIVEPLNMFNEFADPKKTTPDTLVTHAELTKTASTCTYGPKSVTVDVRLAFKGLVGPQGRTGGIDTPEFSYPYFVAIAAPGGKILAKEVFAAPMTFEPGMDNQVYTENLRQIIPFASQTQGAAHKVLLGFQLGEGQLAYNRMVLKKIKEEQAAADLAERKRMEREAAHAKPAAGQAQPPAAARYVTPDYLPTAPKAEPPLMEEGPVILSPQH
ncbi:MAG: hypothetical protein IT558_05810 [Alphaproteobacteria bacterium]|nr:hypothetical protein [Alphaproteobacteria bacterium]